MKSPAGQINNILFRQTEKCYLYSFAEKDNNKVKTRIYRSKMVPSHKETLKNIRKNSKNTSKLVAEITELPDRKG